jgi:LPS O-antigen subunit length determinant protein (WzzB/FepE family)
MANDLNQSQYVGDDIDLKKIFKILIESKKLIILTTLIFTVVSIVYSLSQKPEFKSSSIFEIGYYEMPNGAHQLLDNPKVLIDDLKLNLIIKNPDNEFNQAVSMKPLQEKLIQFTTASFSSEKNEKLLNKFFSYIDNRHRNYLHNQIDLIESEIELERLNITNAISKKSADIPFLDQRISQLRKIIADNNNILFLLQNDPQLFIERASISPNLNVLTDNLINKVTQLVNEKNTLLQGIDKLNNQLKFENKSIQSNKLLDLTLKQEALEIELESIDNQKIINGGVISDIKITTIKPKYLSIITLGIVFGFITGILLVFIRNFMKSYRESEA